MTAFDTGRIFGAIFIAAIPTSIACYKICMTKYKNKPLAILGAISCVLMSFVGGLLLALPTLGIFVAIGKFSYHEEEIVSEEQMPSNVIKLEKLHELKQKGILTEQEFEEEKKKLLAS